MGRRNYTREILKQIEEGRTAFCSIGPLREVTYAPRSKSDPKPWTCGVYRYNGRYVHTVAPCHRVVLMWSGRVAHCVLVGGHDGACLPNG